MEMVTFKRGLLTTAFALTLLVAASPMSARAGSSKRPTSEQLIDQANRNMATDHVRFMAALNQLNEKKSRLSPAQQQMLEFYNAIKYNLSDQSDRAVRMFTDIIQHPVDLAIAARARTALIAVYLRQRQYIKAYSLANALMTQLPRINDYRVRQPALLTITRVLISEKRFIAAAGYARQLEARATTPSERCQGRVFRTQALLYSGQTLSQAHTNYVKAISLCRDAGMLNLSNGLRLDWGSRISDEGHPDQAIAYLRKITPGILKAGFQPHLIILHIALAQAYLKQGDYKRARQSALAALSENHPDGFNWSLQATYKLLYQIAKHAGDNATALAMFQKYMAQYKATEDDAKAQAIAYQVVKQDVLAKKMQLDKLARKNRILQLRQSLDSKSAETNRLYISLLLVVLASIVFWAWRIKHSQIRFRKLARHDDLTGIFNRQHFFDQAELTLHRLQQTSGHACLMILDMDHFKRINDAYGHVAGDTVLKHVVHTCREQLRDSDLFGRLGGEEFGILMPGCNIAQGTEIGERIRRSLAQSPVKVLDSETVIVTSSIGLADTEEHGYALKPLLMAADHALYGAKRGGRNRLFTHKDLSSPTTN